MSRSFSQPRRQPFKLKRLKKLVSSVLSVGYDADEDADVLLELRRREISLGDKDLIDILAYRLPNSSGWKRTLNRNVQVWRILSSHFAKLLAMKHFA